MNLETFEARVKELENALNESGTRHNVLVGQLAEARNLLELIKQNNASASDSASKEEKSAPAEA